MRRNKADKSGGPAGGISMPSKWDLEHLSDLGNAKRLIALHGDKMRHVKEWGWLIWDGRRWQLDKRGMVERLAKSTVASIYVEVGQLDNDKDRMTLANFALKSESVASIKAMIEHAKSEEIIGVGPEQFDRNPMLFNCLNGTLDLRTGQLLPHNPADLITKLAPVEFNPEATCPIWLNFLNKIMQGKKELVEFIRRAVGYSLTGSTRQHCWFFLYGTGSNGKSTFLELIQTMLGDYAKTAQATTFLAKDTGGDGPRNDIAKLVGARFVKTAEIEKGRRWAEALIKEITGGDVISARFLYHEEFDYKPQFKLWVAANHKPKVLGQDNGMWRRIRLVPFEVQISDDEKDPDLPLKLTEELPGILAWAMEGCLDWQQNGLQEPQEVLAATEAYKDESDILRDFINDCCFRGRADKHKTTLKDLYKTYALWCGEGGERPIGKQNFSQALQERGYAIGPGSKNITTVFGLSLLEKERDEQDFSELWPG